MVSFGVSPLKYVEYMPWKYLEPCQLEHTAQESEECHLVSWKPERVTQWERYMYTDDHTFGTCVMSGIQFPGYRQQGSVLFVLSSISDFKFETVHHSFWQHCFLDHINRQ